MCSTKKAATKLVVDFHNNSADYQNFTDRSVSLQPIFLTQNQIVNQVNIFFSASTSWPAAICESVDCVVVSKLL